MNRLKSKYFWLRVALIFTFICAGTGSVNFLFHLHQNYSDIPFGIVGGVAASMIFPLKPNK